MSQVKMKVLILTCMALLLIETVSGGKIRASEKHAKLEEAKAPEAKSTAKVEMTATDSIKKEKEVRKRGILHYGSASGSLWPKTYASHYGYALPAASSFSLHPLSATHLHAPAVLKYNNGFQYRPLAAPTLVTGAAGLNAALPNYGGVSPIGAHTHTAATAQPFIIRPGGALVQSYSVTYPRRKTAVAINPIHGFASVGPVQHLHPVQPVAAVQPVHSFQTIPHLQHAQPVQPVTAVQPIQPVSALHHVHHIPPVQPVQHLHPVQPVQTVLQVQHLKPPIHYYFTQSSPSFFQSSFIPPAPIPAISQPHPVAITPAQPVFPTIPAFPNPPAFPPIPTVPAIPQPPPIPNIPIVPAVPPVPTIPTIPSIPNFPQPQVPANGFFPVNVQPPLNQKPPIFANPDIGSAEAAPQIPAQPLPGPEPELPAYQPEATQQHWKPILYDPPTVESSVGRPSHTLLPPYGNSPAEGYLPPAPPSSHRGRLQQEYTVDAGLFDNLSDADIQEIFAQANLAAQRDHHNHHHTVHNYHAHY